MILLWDALGLGMHALTISANTQTGEDEKLEGPALYLTLAVSILFGLGLFFAAPALAGWFFEQTLGWGAYLGAFMEGLLRLGLLIGYIWLIGFMPDVRRLFGYHGAEHKTINAFEAGAELTPENVAGFSVEHPRCGTAFLLMLVVFSIIFFSLLGPLPIGMRLLSRILFIPVLAAWRRVHPVDGEPSRLAHRPLADQAQPGIAAPDHPRTRPGDAGGGHHFVPDHAASGEGIRTLRI
jgi:uncharacterized protein YqhQ